MHGGGLRHARAGWGQSSLLTLRPLRPPEKISYMSNQFGRPVSIVRTDPDSPLRFAYSLKMRSITYAPAAIGGSASLSAKEIMICKCP
jgi:hypothetical protein